jgi:hypothetical protein
MERGQYPDTTRHYRFGWRMELANHYDEAAN